MEIPNKYNPNEAEPRWQKYWEKHKTYAFNKKKKEKIYSIDTPPPTVSGKMHMGHAFGNSQQDFVARYKRMQGFNVLQPFGTDDNGLPTQTLIQKIKKVRAQDMSRKDFVKLCLKTLKEELRPEYLGDWKRLGISCDFDVTYTTINEHSRRISQKSFLELYEMGRAYRKEAPAIWCPKCQTAIAQVELEDVEHDSQFNDIVFKVDDGNKEQEIIIATTRPELLPACVAVFFHPDDKRYQKWKGKMAKVPLFDFEVPILPDTRADPKKGTGIVMCCTFGDQTDIEWQKAHNLPIKSAIGRDGKLTSLAGEYEGKKVSVARKDIITDMKNAKLLKEQRPIKHAVNTHERCGTAVEFVHSKQWFIKYLDLKKELLKWGNELNWFPAHMKNRYDNWTKGLAWDWCISRQISFGIPFPVWYCEDCQYTILAKLDNLPVDPTEDSPPVDNCPECKSKNIIGESDIINTWATSSLTPTIVKELFKGEPVYDYLSSTPMDLRPQGHDIISFWLFNTVVKSQLHFKMKPWNDCFINGWMLDPKGKKMSKSKGNVIEPQGMIDKYSADGLRFMSAGCKLGEDFPFQEKDIITGQKMINKLWNASKFALMHLEDYDEKKNNVTEIIDKWLLSKLNRLIKTSTDTFENHEFFRTKAETEKFFWHTFCDNYLEIVKDRLYNPDQRGKEERVSAQSALYLTILSVLKLMAPIMPHITEEIYHLYFAKRERIKSIHISNWPIYDKNLIDEEIELFGDFIMRVISEVRKKKNDHKLSLKDSLRRLTLAGNFKLDLYEASKDDLKAVTGAVKIEFTKAEKECIEVEI